ncbi:thiamine diphosphokinase [Shimazuella sp. AN120528]|uniref:thiamine diphosphokinase n=1 Tax=Shimazuella soli TaxID=1892854 RepID=UPI001F0FFDDF|nr:thiamine diphosphokinase [Shimazuella soli]MCH5584876.1 thiamine diphosphokinase [Shimazuella soli]
MTHKRVIVVAGGAVTKKFLQANIEETDIVIGADYGVIALLEAGIIPQVAIGDFDTAGEEKLQKWQTLGIKIVPLPSMKDVTDTHAAIEESLSYDPQEVYLFGAFGGGRMDHTLANIGLLEWLASHGVQGIIQDETNRLSLLVGPAELQLTHSGYTYVSLIPVSEKVAGISTNGLTYPLKGETLIRGETRGISNEMRGKMATVSISSGKCLVSLSKDKCIKHT